MNIASQHKHIERLVNHSYRLGHVVGIEQVLGGYCNKSYAVWMEKDRHRTKYLLREYNPDISEAEIRFEHALIRHLHNRGFTRAAGVVSRPDGSSFVHLSDPVRENDGYWAMFEFLEGENKYTWYETDLTDPEFESSAEMLAQLHRAACDFQKPAGADRAQPRIMEYLATFPQAYRAYAQQGRGRKCDRLLLEHLDDILNAISTCLKIKDHLQGLLEVAVHCDFHPGNIKYRNFKAVGLFDFDWSKIDYRLFDVALSLIYFVSAWNGETAGSLRLDKFELFLKAYDQTCKRVGRIEPLSRGEQEALVAMLTAANLYVLNWDLMDFYRLEDPDDTEYYTYIDHNLQLMYWIEDHRCDIEAVIQKVCR